VALSLGGLGGCTADRPAGNPDVSRPSLGPGEATVRVLQMNLCNSGRSGCYSGGRAVSTAAALVSRYRPDLVSLNEVCRGDVDVLERALSAASRGAAVASAFEPARDPGTSTPVRCQNGQSFGNGVLAVPASPTHRPRILSGVYPPQDPPDMEERVWVCLDLARQFLGCTTHTAVTDPAIALAQCRDLMSSAVRWARRHDDGGPIIVAGDLNLTAGGSPSPDSCLPRGYRRADDGGRQDVMASPGVDVRSRAVLDMRGATDHPGLLVDLVLTRVSSS
jgi:hypothetical protein